MRYPRAPKLGVGDEVGVVERRVGAVSELELHLPSDQPVLVVDPDQHDDRDPFA
jgi:hypothetical protein